jgi:RHS repeat-associated protein
VPRDLVAERVQAGANNTLYYLHGDHLRSTTSVTCGSTGATSACATLGAEVARQYYYPYGGVRYNATALPTDHGFTGQIADNTGLMFYGARYYDPYLHRFISADTIVPGAGNPQALNRYSYAFNDPIAYTDPTGHMACDDPMGTCQGGDGTSTSPGCQVNCSGGTTTSPGCQVNCSGDGNSGGNSLGIALVPPPMAGSQQQGGGGDPVLSPLAYDTLTISGHGIGKLLFGVEINFSVNIDMKSMREHGITAPQAFSASADAALTVGISGEIAGGLSVVGSDGSVKSQRGVKIVGKDGVPGNAVGCVELCLGAQGTFDTRAHNGVASQFGYFIGYGAGIDLGIDLVQASDWFGYVDPSGRVGPQLPFLNPQFWKDVLP